MNAPSPSRPAPDPMPPRLGFVVRTARIAAVALLSLVSLALIAWLTLHWGILPRIDHWRPAIERHASAALGLPVRIGSIGVESSGWVPALDLRDVRVLDREGRAALTLQHTRAALAPQSLLVLELRLAQLHVEGLELDVRRDAQGRVHVAGLELGAGGAGEDDGAAADWLFSQSEIVLRAGRLRWTDEASGAPPLQLDAVDLVLRNGLRRHEIRVDATPAPEWGERFTVSGRFTQSLLARRGDWRQWSGTLYVHLPQADLAHVHQVVDLPYALDAGRGSARAWLEVQRGRWREATVDVALADLALQLQPTLAPLAVTELAARLSARRDEHEVTFGAKGLTFATADGWRWPEGDLSLSLRQAQSAAGAAASAPAAQITGGRLAADRIDLRLVAAVAERLPLPPAARTWVAELQPAGVVSGLQAQWQGPIEQPAGYSAQGRVTGLVLAASRVQAGSVGRPGLAGGDIDFKLTDRGGQARLAMAGGALIFPGVFELPVLPLQRLNAALAWTVTPQPDAPGAIEVKVTDAQFANADARGDLRAVWRTGRAPAGPTAAKGVAPLQGAGSAGASVGAKAEAKADAAAPVDAGPGARWPGTLELSGRIERAQASRVAAYLPMALPQSVRRYVERAVRGGTVDGGTFVVKGDLWHFPFHPVPGKPPTGQFRISGQVRDATFAYLPSVPAGGDEAAWNSPWPAFTGVSGVLTFERTSMRLDDVSARLWGVDLKGVRARIDDLTDHPLLRVEGGGRGPAGDVLRYVSVTPVGGWIGGGLEPLTASGQADLALDLAIPLLDPERAAVRGQVVLGGNDIRVRPDTPLLAGARGRVEFTERGFQVIGASARVFGGDAQFAGGLQADGTLRFEGQGVATADGLRRGEVGLLGQIAPALRGQAAYCVVLGIVDGRPELTVTSDLAGIESTLPVPLAKPAAAAWPMRWQTTLQRDTLGPGRKPQDTLRFDLGDVLQARLTRDLSGSSVHIAGGSIGVMDTLPAPGAGVRVAATLPALDVDAWQRVWARLGGMPVVGAAGPAPVAAPAPAGLPPLHLALRVDDLVADGRHFRRVEGEVQHDPQLADAPWRAGVQSTQLAGRITWRGPRDPADPGLVTARLSRLQWPASERLDVEPVVDTTPARVPAFDVVVDDFEAGGRKLGRLELQAVNRMGPVGVREWQLQQLQLATREATLKATGTWAPSASEHARRTALDFGVEITDAGALAERLGAPGTVRGGKGTIGGRLSWPGTPLQFTLRELAGELKVDLEAGQFLRAEPGVSRLLGVVSLQSLPRRLLLDFRDVFQEGFSFDRVQGDVTIALGRARTQNLRMRGVQAAVLMEGVADLGAQTQDLRVVIVPEINAGAASLAYAAINPAIGLGSFLAQWVLREPLIAAGTREFHVTGAWDSPKVERVERAAEVKPAAPSKETPG